MNILNLIIRALLLWFAFCPVAFAAPQVMTIVYADYRPYSWLENDQPRGLEIDVLNEALGKRMGIKLEHLVLPWLRAQYSVRSGVADAFVATSDSERSAFATPTKEPVTYWEVSLFVRAGDRRFSNIKTLADLKPFRIGSLIGNGWIKENLHDMDIHYVERMELLPKMLSSNHIDVIADNSYVMYYALQKSGENANIDEVPLNFLTSSMYLQIGKNSRFIGIAKKFDETIVHMRNDGTLQRIYSRYKRADLSH
jgi:polar amino acid transport system substrate-binding protein